MPTVVRETLHAQLAPYRDRFRDVRWTAPATWHLTLLFLGSVPAARVPAAAELCQAVGARAAGPYRVMADQGGGRRGRRQGDGVGWLALSDGDGSLIELAEYAARTCPSELTTSGPPKRTLSAHLTVVRRADERVIQALRDEEHGPLSVAWEVDAVELVRSYLGRDGARYETVHRSRL